MATLYIVATPIGNLEDISMRALRVLAEADFILCEDTRVTKKLLDHYGISTPLISYHQHSETPKTEKILSILAEGKDLALVTDAGTPGISDPGGRLVQDVIEEFGEDVKVESIPGPSAVTAALSISGIPTDRFVFLGFPPHKKGRQTFIRKILESDLPVVVYESKYRIIKFLEELTAAGQGLKSRIEIKSVVVCREISKMHETVYRGDLETIIGKIKEDENAQKGEFVVIIAK